MDHPRNEYRRWKETYPATDDEWEGWAERMVAAFDVEIAAAQRDYERHKIALVAMVRYARARDTALDWAIAEMKKGGPVHPMPKELSDELVAAKTPEVKQRLTPKAA